MLLVARMGLAGLVLLPLFLRRGGREELRVPGARLRLAAMGVNSAVGLLAYVVAIRRTDVAIAVFLAYMAPVYVSLTAPRIFHQAYDRVVFVALAIALPGMAAIVLPGDRRRRPADRPAGTRPGGLLGRLVRRPPAAHQVDRAPRLRASR